MPDAYPLQWPDGWKRTRQPVRSRYKVTPGRARNELLDSIRKLGGHIAIISSNMELRRDGLPYSNRREPEDTGVAVYWVRRGRQEVMACDQWKSTWENMRAITLAIEGLRAMERAGATQIMERAFQAFQLPSGDTPENTPDGWREVLGVESNFDPSEEHLRRLVKVLLAHYHPDKPSGDEEKFKRIQKAGAQALKEIRAIQGD